MPMTSTQSTYIFPVETYRKDFPILQTTVHGKPLIYFDNGASTQKPIDTIERIYQFDSTAYANIHRGVHELSASATESYEAVRKQVQTFIHAESHKEIIFTRGTTESINLVAHSWGDQNISSGDEIVISTMEHHSNIVPWQILCERKKAVLKIIPITDSGEIKWEDFENSITANTKLISITHISNTLGTINPIQKICQYAKSRGITVLVDGAQAVSHTTVDVQELGCDFYAFSAHKLFAPSGVGVLYGKKQLLDAMQPWQGGGDMIKTVSFEKTTYAESPAKFEAGTPNISGVIGFGASLDYLAKIDTKKRIAYEKDLLDYGTQALQQIEGLKIYGEAKDKICTFSFLVEGTHPYDVGVLLDKQGVAIRIGNHCTEPLMNRFKIPGTIRASLSFYNTREEIDQFVKALNLAVNMLR